MDISNAECNNGGNPGAGNQYVEIERTGAYLLPMDIADGIFADVHLGVDIHSGNLTLPGGNIVPSDSNLYAAATRETGQEFGRHMKYALLASKPIVFLLGLHTDKWVQNPKPGEKVKLRVVFPVISKTPGLQPRQQPRPEVINPKSYAISPTELASGQLRGFDLQLRELVCISLRIARERSLWPHPPVSDGEKPDFESMREDMRKLLISPEIIDWHCSRRSKSTAGGSGRQLRHYLSQIDAAHKKRLRLLEQDRKKLGKR